MVSDMEQGLRDAPIVEVVIAIEVNKGRRNLSIFGVVIASIAAVVLFVLQHPHPPIYSRVYYCIIAAAVAVVAALAAGLFQWNRLTFMVELKRRRSEHSAMEEESVSEEEPVSEVEKMRRERISKKRF